MVENFGAGTSFVASTPCGDVPFKSSMDRASSAPPRSRKLWPRLRPSSEGIVKGRDSLGRLERLQTWVRLGTFQREAKVVTLGERKTHCSDQ